MWSESQRILQLIVVFVSQYSMWLLECLLLSMPYKQCTHGSSSPADPKTKRKILNLHVGENSTQNFLVGGRDCCRNLMVIDVLLNYCLRIQTHSKSCDSLSLINHCWNAGVKHLLSFSFCKIKILHAAVNNQYQTKWFFWLHHVTLLHWASSQKRKNDHKWLIVINMY